VIYLQKQLNKIKMETTEKTMTPEQSLQVIEQMISATKTTLAKEDSLMYLTWAG